jgi:hypothetical protein
MDDATNIARLTMTSTAHAEPSLSGNPPPAVAAQPMSQALRRAQIIHEIMEHRYLQAYDRGNPEAIGRAEIHLINAVRRCQAAAGQPITQRA